MSAPQHISPALIGTLDDRLDELIRRVEDGEAAKASLSLNLAVGYDREGLLLITAQVKAGDTSDQGSFVPAPRAQTRLDFDADAEAA